MLQSLKKRLKQNEVAWRYVFNFQPSLDYRKERATLSDFEKRLLVELNTNGFAKTNVDELLADTDSFEHLVNATAELELERSNDIEQARAGALDPNPREGKSFKISLLGPKPVFDPESAFAKFAMQKSVLRIANAYLGLFAQIKYYNVWRNFAVDHQAKSSQLWHHDRDDTLILKMFVYLSDVDEGSGAFTYGLGTHRKGARRVNPPSFVENGVARSTDEQMRTVLAPEHCRLATGQKGTIVFADTRGYHKGGLARTEERLLYTCMYTSPRAEIAGLMKNNVSRNDERSPQMKWLLPV